MCQLSDQTVRVYTRSDYEGNPREKLWEYKYQTTYSPRTENRNTFPSIEKSPKHADACRKCRFNPSSLSRRYTIHGYVWFIRLISDAERVTVGVQVFGIRTWLRAPGLILSRSWTPRKIVNHDAAPRRFFQHEFNRGGMFLFYGLRRANWFRLTNSTMEHFMSPLVFLFFCFVSFCFCFLSSVSRLNSTYHVRLCTTFLSSFYARVKCCVFWPSEFDLWTVYDKSVYFLKSREF